jgi:hypothetical protein
MCRAAARGHRPCAFAVEGWANAPPARRTDPQPARRAQRHDLCFVGGMERTVNTAVYCIMVIAGADVCLFGSQRRTILVGALLILGRWRSGAGRTLSAEPSADHRAGIAWS